jgi:hypothetical protein
VTSSLDDVIRAYSANYDVTLIDEALALTVAQRVENFVQAHEFFERVRGCALHKLASSENHDRLQEPADDPV